MFPFTKDQPHFLFRDLFYRFVFKYLCFMNNRLFFMHSVFSGHVQGVGFRYQVVSMAKGFDLTGYVKNFMMVE